MTAFLNEDGVTALTSEIKDLADNTYAAIQHTHGAADLPSVGTSWVGTSESRRTDGAKHVQIFGTFAGPIEGSIYFIHFSNGNVLPSFSLALNNMVYPVSLGYVDTSNTNALIFPAGSIVTFVYMRNHFIYVSSSIAATGDTVHPEGSKIWYAIDNYPNPTASNKNIYLSHFRLEVGATIVFRAADAQVRAGALTLTVNTDYWNTTYPISVSGVVTSSTNSLYWSAGDSLFFCFTGASWDYIDLIPADVHVNTLNAQEDITAQGDISAASLTASGGVFGDSVVATTDIVASGGLSGATLDTSGDASIGGNLLLGDEAAGHNIDSVLSSGTRYFDIFDSTGAPVWRFYMSYAGSLARQQYSNGAWGAAQYFIPRDSIADLFVIETKSATIGAVSANGGTKWVTVTCSKTNYTLIGPMGWYINGAGALTIYNLKKSSATTCSVAFRNPTSSASSATATIEISALFIRSSW